MPSNDVPTAVSKPHKHTILFATNNPHKVSEVQEAVGDSIEMITLRDAGITIDIPEPHLTLEENAREKAMTLHRMTGLDCFSEDTGLEVDVLHGAPGVHSAYYGGPERSSIKNTNRLLKALRDKKNRIARFRTVICLIWHGKVVEFEGICNGHIASHPQGEQGFGYDPVFIPEGYEKTFAEMTAMEKNACSHRKKAVDQMIAFMKKAE